MKNKTLGAKPSVLLAFGFIIFLISFGLLFFNKTDVYARGEAVIDHGGSSGRTAINGSFSDVAIKAIDSNTLEISFKTVGLNNIDGYLIKNGEQEVARASISSINKEYQVKIGNLTPATEHNLYLQLYNSADTTNLFGPYAGTTLAAEPEAVAPATVSLVKSVLCQSTTGRQVGLISDNLLQFNLINAALASSLGVVSDSANYLISIFAFLLLASLILIIINIKHRPSFKHLKLLPALAWQKPMETFRRLAMTDGEGSWSVSYSRHRIYHHAGTTGFWGTFTAVGVKIALVVALSGLAAMQSAPSRAQEDVFTDCQNQKVKVGSILKYSLTFNIDQSSPHDFFTDVVISDLIPKGTEFVAGSLTAAGSSALKFDSQENKVTADFSRLQPGNSANAVFQAKVVGGVSVIANSGYASYEPGKVVESNAVNNFAETVKAPAPAPLPKVPPQAKLPVRAGMEQPRADEDLVKTGKNAGETGSNSGSAGQTARINNASGQINQVEVLGPKQIRANFKIFGSSNGAWQIILLFQSNPIIKTFSPSGNEWEYEANLVMEPGEHTLIVSGKDEAGNTLNEIGPIAFTVPDQPISNPIVFGEKPVAPPAGELDFLTQDLKSFINNPTIEKINEQTVVPVLAALAVANAATAIPFIQLLPYLQYLFTEPFYFLIRRRRYGWGVIYNSLTKQPVDLAVVRLYSKNTHRLVQTQVTDREGRYHFIVKEPGKYHITVTKPEYIFPSKILKNQKEDAKYLDLYFGQSIMVKPGGKEGVITINIPLDSDKRDQPNSKIVGWYIAQRVQNLVGSLGICFSILTCIISPKPLILTLLLLHLILYFLFRRLAWEERPKSWGVVYDKKNRRHLAYAVARIYDQKYNHLLETQVSDPAGRYSFLVGNNVYYLTAEKDGYQKNETEPIDLTRHRHGSVVGLDIGLKRIKN